jgi:O-acetyl-ADP-ribose deacetylase (regulator of RNase III)
LGAECRPETFSLKFFDGNKILLEHFRLIEVVKCDIAEEKVAAIVSESEPNMFNDEGLAKHIVGKAGKKVEEACLTWVRTHGDV